MRFKPERKMKTTCFTGLTYLFPNTNHNIINLFIKSKVRTFPSATSLLMLPRSWNLQPDISTTKMESLFSRFEIFGRGAYYPFPAFLSHPRALQTSGRCHGDRLSPEPLLLGWDWTCLGGFDPLSVYFRSWTFCVWILRRTLRYGICL